MKIICVGRNYSEHAKELQNEVPESPVIFLKPDTALLKDNKPFYLPEWSSVIHYEAEVGFKVSKNGKYIDKKHAWDYVNQATLGIDFTARDLQSQLKQKGLPWELSKAFDHSAIIGKWMKLNDISDPQKIHFSLSKNEETVQQADTSQMIFGLPELISFISQYISLRMGDIIFTGTPAGVGRVSIGDVYKGFIGDKEVFSFKVK